MQLFKKLVESGVREDQSPSTRRVIILSNYIALTLVLPNIFLFIRIPGNHNMGGFLEMLLAIGIFSFPIVLNRWHLTLASRLYECWLPPILVIWYMTAAMRDADVVSVAAYDGLRFYLLATSCIPYLLLERKNALLLVSCILPGFIAIVFCDPILNFLGVGIHQKGIPDPGYHFTPIRSFAAYLIINGGCLSLKRIVNATDELNEKLYAELAEKNKILQSQSEEKLRQSEHKYRSLFEQASDGILISDEDGNLIDCNPRITELLRYPKEELLKLKLTDIIDREQLQVYPVRYDLLHAGQHIFNERYMVRKDGSRVEVESSVKKMKDNMFLAFVRDISQRKKIERELKEAEAKFRNLVEQSLVGVYIIKGGKFVYVNPQFAATFGYSQHELINNYPVDIVVHPEDRTTVAENLRARIEGEKASARYEIRGIKKNGETNWIEVFGNLTQYENGPAVIGTLIDISERKKSQDQAALFASIVNSSEDAIISKSLDGTITSWNQGAKKLFGYDALEVIGKPIQILIPDDHHIEELYIMNAVNAGKAVEHFETRRRKKNGEIIYISLTVSPVIDATGKIIGASRIARDITTRKEAEAEKEYARYLLNERIKELRTLYAVGQILQSETESLQEILQNVVSVLPPGWQYPEITAARIVLGPQEFVTSNYSVGVDRQQAEFSTPDGFHGKIEVIYLIEKAPSAEGPFLAEERNLINMLADMLRVYLTRKLESDALKKSEASLNATINNTSFYIWSVNEKYELQNINKPFKQFIRDQFGFDIREGQSVLTLSENHVTAEVFTSRWIDLYTRAMAGESFELEEEHSGRYFKYSLNPIIENEMVTGVSVFSEETTALIRKEKELTDAHKQIGDLKLMALRAAMNPHFIFNTLNSIQYYIMENDKRNAVNYLSTFSKLIRGILNNSVQTKVKLSDELEMLTHYVTLEQMRFENKFDFLLEVEPDLDVENIEIPSMLIQPYVENAILHGINNKVGRGTLKISVKDATECVLFEVEDDGIGREATQKLHRQNLNEHKSFGTALTEERLKLINAQRNVSYEIIDLKEEGKSVGTRVKIWVSE